MKLEAHKILVYGTLRPSYKGKPPGETRLVPGLLYDLGWFPGIVLGSSPDEPLVLCEVITADDDQLQDFDEYEGYNPNDHENSLYIRRQLDLDGETFWIYEYNESVRNREPIESVDGVVDWLKQKGKV